MPLKRFGCLRPGCRDHPELGCHGGPWTGQLARPVARRDLSEVRASPQGGNGGLDGSPAWPEVLGSGFPPCSGRGPSYGLTAGCSVRRCRPGLGGVHRADRRPQPGAGRAQRGRGDPFSRRLPGCWLLPCRRPLRGLVAALGADRDTVRRFLDRHDNAYRRPGPGSCRGPAGPAARFVMPGCGLVCHRRLLHRPGGERRRADRDAVGRFLDRLPPRRCRQRASWCGWMPSHARLRARA